MKLTDLPTAGMVDDDIEIELDRSNWDQLFGKFNREYTVLLHTPWGDTWGCAVGDRFHLLLFAPLMAPVFNLMANRHAT